MPGTNPQICEVCQTVFTPDPRVGSRQRVCKKLYCQKQRKRDAQQKWLTRNPDYFKARYPQLKEKILKQRRSKKQSDTPVSSHLSKQPTGIQDEIINCYYNTLSRLLKNINVKDKITSTITAINLAHGQQIQIVYKTSEALIF